MGRGHGKALATLEGHGGQVEFVAFSPDGKTLACGGGKGASKKGDSPGEVRLWDVATRKALRALEGHPDYVPAGAFSHDGKTLATGCYDGAVRLWDVGTGKLRSRLAADEGAVRIAFSPDGTALVTGGADKSLKVWDPVTGKLQQTLRGHKGRVNGLAFSRDGRLLASVALGARRPGVTLVEEEVKVWERVKPPAGGK